MMSQKKAQKEKVLRIFLFFIIMDGTQKEKFIENVFMTQ